MSLLLDAPSRTTSQRLSVPGTMGDFSVDLEGEWVRSLGGLSDDHVSRGMTGSQSLRIDLAAPGLDLAQLHELLKYLLANYEDTRYREHFGFIDLVVPLHREDRRVERLDAALAALLVRGDRDDRAHRAAAAARGPYTRCLPSAGSMSAQVRSFDVLGLRYAVRETGDPLHVRVEGLDSDGQHVGSTHLLRECLVAEVVLDDERYVLTEGRWFRVDPARLAELDRELAAIPELLSERLDMPMWVRADSEGDYNATAAEIGDGS